MKRIVAAVLLCVTLGCDDKKSTNTTPSIVVTEDDNTKEVTLKKGQAIQIKLNSDGVADCFWGCKKAPPTVEFLTEGKEGNVFEFNFKVLDNGPITLEYVQFTETGVQKKKDFTINIKIAE